LRLKLLPLFASALVLTAPTLAQERTAGQGNDAQINWSLLSNQMDLLKTQNQSLATALEEVQKKLAGYDQCSAKGKIYAPGQTGADADGCLAPESISEVGLVSLSTSGWGGKPVTDYRAFCVGKGYKGYTALLTGVVGTRGSCGAHATCGAQNETTYSSTVTGVFCYR